MKRIQNFFCIFSCVVVTASCTPSHNDLFAPNDPALVDPELNLDRNAYSNSLNPNEDKSAPLKHEDPKVTAEVLEPPIPDIAEVLAAPKPPKLGETKQVSIAVTDDVPLKDILIELARLAEVDIEVDSSITGGISFSAKNRPFNEVIERIADLAGLRYTMKNNVLRIERDTPYVQDYPINFLNMDRNSNENINITSTGAGSSNSNSTGATGTGGTNTSSNTGSNGNSNNTNSSGSSSGSTSSVTSKSDSDFWKQFEASIKQILAYSDTKRISGTSIAAQPAPLPAGAVAVNPADPGANADKGTAFYIMNRQASTLTVSATDKQHEMIRRFLRMIDANTSSQVLIEAKVLEVTLNDEFQSGIDWTKLGSNKFSFAGNFNAPTTTSSTNSGIIDIGVPHPLALTKNIDLSATVKLLDQFGATRALSSPRLNAMNNQQAVLSFAEGLVYFQVHIDTTDAVLGTNQQIVTPSKITVTSNQLTAPIGIILTLQPSIDEANDEITLSVRPTLTRLTKIVSDPGFEVAKASAIAQLAASGASASVIANLSAVTSTVPQIETREVDSILKIKSGQTLVFGGLLEDSYSSNDSGVPGVSEVPWFGSLFKGVDKVKSKKELVIFMRASIINPAGKIDKFDKALYEKFGNDPRPINFNQQ